jgi:hypothetical protein
MRALVRETPPHHLPVSFKQKVWMLAAQDTRVRESESHQSGCLGIGQDEIQER